MSIADKAIWVIERNSDQAIGLNAIAAACGVSRSHLANAFGTATGTPVMKYLRGRRLSEAARVLAGGAPDILTVAFDAGYGSHEAFTRAFRDRFAVTPESVRDAGSLDGLAITEPLRLEAKATTSIDPPRYERLGTIRVVGLSERCSFDGPLEIAAQWRRFVSTLYDGIPGKLEAMPIGVCRAPDDEGRFDYICATEVSEFGKIPAGLVKLQIESRRYAVFEHRGHVSKIGETYSAIWNEALTAHGCAVADAPILEHHNDAFDPDTGEGGVTLWIPLAE
jgi:AraC family transcriptional regulator